MQKDHYKFSKDDIPHIRRYLNSGIIPPDKRRDRYISKHNGLVLHNNQLTFNNKKIVLQEDVSPFILSYYKNTNTGLVNPQTLYTKMRRDYIGFTRNQVIQEIGKLKEYQVHKPIKTLSVKKSILVSGPLVQWQIDITSLEPYNGYQYIIVVIDVFSKYIYTKATKTKDARKVVEFLRSIFIHEKPISLQSDRGGEFVNELMENLLEEFEVKQILSKAYTPQTQGLVERTNRTLKGMLHKAMTIHNTKNWPSLLASITKNYNDTTKRAIDSTPNEVKVGDPAIIKSIAKDMKLTAKKQQKKNKRTFEPLFKGDVVRIELKRNAPNSVFTKYYTQNWSNELYVVERVKRATKVSEPFYMVNGVYHGRNKLQKVPILNRKVEIYWKGEDRWFRGIVKEKKDFHYRIEYEDGDVQWHKWNPNKWRFI